MARSASVWCERRRHNDELRQKGKGIEQVGFHRGQPERAARRVEAYQTRDHIMIILSRFNRQVHSRREAERVLRRVIG